MVGWHEKGDDIDDLKAHEAKLDTRFAVVRMYNQWKLPGRRVDQLVGEGRLVISSHKPPAPGDGGWRRVASGREDRMIRALADKYAGYGREVIFNFHHEPHDDARDVKRRGRYGDSDEYRAAWQRIHRIFVEEKAAAAAGGNVFFAYIGTGSQVLRGDPAGSADRLYPGDDVVDLFAHDRYNWASCRGDRWETFEENWAPLVALAKAHGKKLLPGEFGSPPTGGRRNQWFRDAADWMKRDPDARESIIGFAYYHSYHDRCHWDFLNQGDDGRRGWIDGFSEDPYFTGTPFSLRDGAPASSPAGPSATIALRSAASSGSGQPRDHLTVSKPAGTEAGDVMLASIVVNDDDPAPRAPGGWTLLRRDALGPVSQAIYVRTATADEPGSYTWRLTTRRRVAGGISTYTGVDPARPVDAHGAAGHTTRGTAIQASSLTTTVEKAVLVHLAAINADTTIAPPGGMTERWEQTAPRAGSSRDITASASDTTPQAEAGPVGGPAATAADAGQNIGALVALRPAPAPGDPAPPAEPPPAQEPAPSAGDPSWGEGHRRRKGLPSGHGEMSGFAASRRHSGWAWGVRDSGNPAVLYALREEADGRFSTRTFPVRGASNRDWEDVVYAEEGGTSYLYIVDTGAKKIHKVTEPDPRGNAPARLVASYRYAFPDASPPGCGPRHNVEAAFLYPPLTGQLHLVRKAKSPAGVYQFGELSSSGTNVPRKVGALEDASCISVASVSADGRMLVTASHSQLRVRRGQGDLESLLAAQPMVERRIDPDNNEGGDFYPWGSANIVIVAENRTTWSFPRR